MRLRIKAVNSISNTEQKRWTGIGKPELIPLGKTILRQVSF